MIQTIKARENNSTIITDEELVTTLATKLGITDNKGIGAITEFVAEESNESAEPQAENQIDLIQIMDTLISLLSTILSEQKGGGGNSIENNTKGNIIDRIQ